MFSSRTCWDRRPNALALAVDRARHSGEPLIDLTESNPTWVGLVDLAPLVAELGHPRGVRYEPWSLGHPVAREAVAASLCLPSTGGPAVSPSQVVISAGTSEVYGWLFKLLCDPGDRVLVPQPSYPLLAWLAAGEGVELLPYSLRRDEGYRIDFSTLEQAVAERGARAIVVVHPNNPTGHFVRRDDADRLLRFARDHDIALIVDEVFADSAHRSLPEDRLPSFVGAQEALTFVLSGASKLLLLPQCKIGWTIVSGPEPLVAEALARLELIADSYLSVSTPAQLALPRWLEHRGAAAAAVRARVTGNLAVLDRVLGELGPDSPVRRLPVEAGWYATLQLPRIHDDDTWAERLVERDRVLVHPGYFFDFDGEGFLVVSLLLEPASFAEAVARLVRGVKRELAEAAY